MPPELLKKEIDILKKNKINIMVSIGLIAMFTLAACSTIPNVGKQADVRVLASYPAGNFLEKSSCGYSFGYN